ncbi:hypothetical protein V5E97_37695 [Singulisphaera sp. Ch08]|uniref:Transposase IS204/IS1001/IS1096/IS1165 DDE domain-containing protein n=1 Tax=Singulisphaera sp. Ch08 TaxID=3120278 RepID=A0AAU7CFX3_9BACT
MTVEPASLCWVTGLMTERRDGLTWEASFAKLPALQYVVSDGGTGLLKGLDLVRAARRRDGETRPLDQCLDVFHTVREGRRALRLTWRRVAKVMEQAVAQDRVVARRGRNGQSCKGHGASAAATWSRAERIWDQALAVEAAWDQARGALELFTAAGRLQDRPQAEAILAEALPRLRGTEWAKTRRLLSRPESLAFLDRVQAGLRELSLDPAVLEAILELEGLSRQRDRSAEDSVAAAVRRGRVLVRTVQLARADPDWPESATRVRHVLRNAWRASSLVECLNSVARMQQSRHRRMTQGLLDLKRLYWNLRRFRTGRRRDQTPYELLGVALPALDWWELLKLSPEQLRQHLSAQRVGE